ncbi:hypothetical protein HD806DRAFT_535658 [Xylariaceae sp. AK1471]|nr:hypothetical protein HD806DRAFT_535658 [Xylariaceae sp. AK1471]
MVGERWVDQYDLVGSLRAVDREMTYPEPQVSPPDQDHHRTYPPGGDYNRNSSKACSCPSGKQQRDHLPSNSDDKESSSDEGNSYDKKVGCDESGQEEANDDPYGNSYQDESSEEEEDQDQGQYSRDGGSDEDGEPTDDFDDDDDDDDHDDDDDDDDY